MSLTYTPPNIAIDNSDAKRRLELFVFNGVEYVRATLKDSSGNAISISETPLASCPTFIALSGTQQTNLINALKGLYQDALKAGGAA